MSAGRCPNPKRLRVGFFFISANSSRADLLESSISLRVLNGLIGSRTEDLVGEALRGRRRQLLELRLVQLDHGSGPCCFFPLLEEAIGVLLEHLVPLLLLHLEE